VKPPLSLLTLAFLALVAGAFAVLGGGRSLAGMPSPSVANSTTTAPLPATRLAALPHSTIANGTEPLAVSLSAPVSPSSPPPTLIPSVAGTWSVAGDSEVFTPSSSLLPCTNYAMIIWARTASTAHTQLGHRRTVHLHVACPPLAGLQQALARLGYLGARFRPLYDVHYAPGRESRREAAEHAFHPPRGRLAADPRDAPPAHLGEFDATTRGALEIYQADNGLQASGEPNRATWLSLLFDVTVDKRDRQPYTWVSVTESLPETLFLHRGHHVVFTTPVNTGVVGAETERGIFPIYSRLVSTTMSGTDPDGTKYVVPDVPWVNYFNGGDAVHGYPRASYGSPQSNGCVELPIEAAHHVFGMLAIGDIVWVQ
jgi:peptidoglycan hydrolase-like protein with peptidoglycan-binding domain